MPFPLALLSGQLLLLLLLHFTSKVPSLPPSRWHHQLCMTSLPGIQSQMCARLLTTPANYLGPDLALGTELGWMDTSREVSSKMGCSFTHSLHCVSEFQACFVFTNSFMTPDAYDDDIYIDNITKYWLRYSLCPVEAIQSSFIVYYMRALG